MHIMIHRICGPWSRQMHCMHTALCAAMHTTCQRMCTVHAVPARDEQAHDEVHATTLRQRAAVVEEEVVREHDDTVVWPVAGSGEWCDTTADGERRCYSRLG